MNKVIVMIIGAAVVVGGGSFFAGMKYGGRGMLQGNFSNLSAEERQARFDQLGGAAGARGMMRIGASGGVSAGEIFSKDDTGITIKMRDGGSKIVFLSASASVMKSVLGSLADLKTGEFVTVTGTSNSDGSITAESVQIRPQTKD